MIGRVYRDAGRRAHRGCPARDGGLVRVLVRWRGRGPRNVLVERVETGERYVRPFRGLRRVP